MRSGGWVRSDVLAMKTSGSTYLAYRRFYATRIVNRAAVQDGAATIRTLFPPSLIRLHGLDVPFVIRADEIDRVVSGGGIAHHGILVPVAGSLLSPIMVSWWLCDALVPSLAAQASHVGYLTAWRIVRTSAVRG